MRKLVTLTAFFIVVLTSSLWGDFNPSSGFLLEPIQRGTEVEFNYVSTYNGLIFDPTQHTYCQVNSSFNYPVLVKKTYVLECHVKLDTLNINNPFMEFIDYQDSIPQNGGIIYFDQNNKLNFDLYNNSSQSSLVSSTSIDSTWNHLLLSWGKNNRVNLYLNGELDTFIIHSDTSRTGIINNRFTIGMSSIDSSFFNGRISEVKMALTGNLEEYLPKAFENYNSMIKEPGTIILSHFDEVTDSFPVLSTFNQSFILSTNADSLSEVFLTNKPSEYLWDINADGTYDTTTSEQTLVYDFGTYDTTQVIAKAIFDSLTYDMDTMSIALFDNITYDSFTVLDTLMTYSTLIPRGGRNTLSPFSISRNGNMFESLVRLNNFNQSAIIYRNGSELYNFDTTFVNYVSCSPNGNFALATTYSFAVDQNYSNNFTLYIDSLANIDTLPSCIYTPYITENDSFIILPNCGYGYMHELTYSGIENPMVNDTLYIFKHDATEFSKLYNPYENYQSFRYQKELDYFIIANLVYGRVSAYDKQCNNLWSLDSIFYAPDRVSTLYKNIFVSFENDKIYAVLCYMTERFSNSTKIIRNAKVQIVCIDNNGNLEYRDNYSNIHVNTLELSWDGRYLLGYNRETVGKNYAVWDIIQRQFLWEKTDQSEYNEYAFNRFYCYRYPNNNVYFQIGNQKYDINGNMIYIKNNGYELNGRYLRPGINFRKQDNSYQVERVELEK